MLRAISAELREQVRGLKVLIDNDLSPHIAAAINALVEPHGHHVVALRKKFAPNTEDVDWIDALVL
jgi:hypothetical protein